LADSIILATAIAFDAAIWTRDSGFENIAGVKFFPKKRILEA
jgi:predicted nucleic acid-binding protein